MPGYAFSGLNISIFNNQALITLDQYKQLMQDLFDKDPYFEYVWERDTEQYQFKDMVPKQKLFIKLNPDVTDE